MASINEKLNYINETKSLIKDKLNNLGSEITNQTTFRDYADKIENLYEEWPKTSDEDTIISLDNTKKAKMNLQLKGNINQFTTTGKNLVNFNKNETVDLYKDITVSLPAGTYTVSCSAVDTTTTDSQFMFQTHYTDNTNGYFSINKTTLKGTITPVKEVDFVRLYSANGYQSSQGIITTYFNLMLENGSTATSYEPYTGGVASPNPDYPQDIEIVTGENTIKIEAENLLNRNACTENYALTWAAGIEWAEAGALTSEYIKIKSGDSFSSNYEFVAFFYRKDKTYIGFYITGGIATTGSGTPVNTFTIPTNNDVYYMRIAYRKSYNDNIDMTTVNVMLNKGTTLLTYKPYVNNNYLINLGNIELCNKNDAYDYIYKLNNKWYKHSEIGKIILNGEEDWNSVTLTTGTRYYYINDDIELQDSYSQGNDMNSNNFTNISWNTYYNTGGVNGISRSYYNSNHGIQLFFETAFNNTDALKTWLSNHNTSVYYILKTPITTEITDTTLITQLNTLEQAISYNNQTNISQINDNLPFIISASALLKNSN